MKLQINAPVASCREFLLPGVWLVTFLFHSERNCAATDICSREAVDLRRRAWHATSQWSQTHTLFSTAHFPPIINMFIIQSVSQRCSNRRIPPHPTPSIVICTYCWWLRAEWLCCRGRVKWHEMIGNRMDQINLFNASWTVRSFARR